MGGVSKSQSAMEYLMTYGWAILIIAVVLGALYSLGIFNGANFLGGTCVAGPGYLCSDPLLSASGTLAFTYGYQGPNVTVIGFACTNTTTAPASFALSGSSDLQPGQEESVSVSCPLQSGATLGTPYSGYLWVEYDQAGQSDLISRFATIRTTVSKSSPAGILYVGFLYPGRVYTDELASVYANNGTIINEYPLTANAYALNVSPGGSTLYAFQGNGNIIAWNPVSNSVEGVVTVPLGANTPLGVGASPNGRYLWAVTGNWLNYDAVAYVISTSSYSIVANTAFTLAYPTNGWNVERVISFSPDGSTAYIDGYGGGMVERISTSNYIELGSTSSLSFPDSIMLSGNGADLYVPGYDGGLYTIDTSNNVVVNTMGNFPSTMHYNILSSEGSYLYAAGNGDNVERVHLSDYTSTEWSTVSNYYSTYLAISSNNSVLYMSMYASGGSPGGVAEINTANGNVIRFLSFPQGLGYVYSTT